ncbi:pentatricopeptide repeat-containing-like protein [Cinnamomum micranthum f. kanehirae]|uniref:Pentatricopeptide repeat-containing-like protein n=1 Tax=Cinnamomum micranthum f. kanehirae TaxID=337451 RepID=A0A3S3NJC5_9MAGN|nr:pentatricopeptide repeat-containing-like protein [Cinnamomum micranthum f. kanehirae]
MNCLVRILAVESATVFLTIVFLDAPSSSLASRHHLPRRRSPLHLSLSLSLYLWYVSHKFSLQTLFASDLLLIDSIDQIEEVIELIKRGDTDMELTLNQVHPNLSIALVCKIIGILNDRCVSALRFLDWVQKTQTDLIPDSGIYNLIIDNTGRMKDYESMFIVLSKLSMKGHCLTEKAFGFLTVCSAAGDGIMDSVERVVETLNRVRGSCHSSGIYALIKTLCVMNSFDGAIFVMEETARKTSYYNVLVAAKCRNGDFQDALDLFDEMRRFRCDPNTKSYNYLLGSLCKKGRITEVCELIEAMEKLGYLPDSVTFEIVIVHACRLGSMDFAIEFLYHMMSVGLEPRITTHAAFIKGYFWSGQVGDAHKYVVDMSSEDKYSANMNYSLLASLFHKSGRVVEARDVLIEMIEKGMKPNFPVFMRVMKDLFKLGKGHLVADLKAKFAKFHSNTGNG